MELLLNWNLLNHEYHPFVPYFVQKFFLLRNTQLTGSHVFNKTLDWLQINKLLCYKLLISIVLSIVHDICSLDETAIDSHKYRYFHLRFLPSPWKSGLYLAAAVKIREEMKHWQKLLLTGITKSHPYRSHGLLTAEWPLHPVEHGKSIHPRHRLHRLCRDLFAYGPTVDHGIWTPKAQAQTTCNRNKLNPELFLYFYNSANATAKFKCLKASPKLRKHTESLW